MLELTLKTRDALFGGTQCGTQRFKLDFELVQTFAGAVRRAARRFQRRAQAVTPADELRAPLVQRADLALGGAQLRRGAFDFALRLYQACIDVGQLLLDLAAARLLLAEACLFMAETRMKRARSG
jgi:hypothetical protein